MVFIFENFIFNIKFYVGKIVFFCLVICFLSKEVNLFLYSDLFEMCIKWINLWLFFFYIVIVFGCEKDSVFLINFFELFNECNFGIFCFGCYKYVELLVLFKMLCEIEELYYRKSFFK